MDGTLTMNANERQILSILHQYFGKSVTVGDVAEEQGISERYCCRLKTRFLIEGEGASNTMPSVVVWTMATDSRSVRKSSGCPVATTETMVRRQSLTGREPSCRTLKCQSLFSYLS